MLCEDRVYAKEFKAVEQRWDTEGQKQDWYIVCEKQIIKKKPQKPIWY